MFIKTFQFVSEPPTHRRPLSDATTRPLCRRVPCPNAEGTRALESLRAAKTGRHPNEVRSTSRHEQAHSHTALGRARSRVMCLVTDEFGDPLPRLARPVESASEWTRPRKVPTGDTVFSKPERDETRRATDARATDAWATDYSWRGDVPASESRRSMSSDEGFDFYDASRETAPSSRDESSDSRTTRDFDASVDAHGDPVRFGCLTRHSLERAMRERGCSALEALARLSREDA